MAKSGALQKEELGPLRSVTSWVYSGGPRCGGVRLCVAAEVTPTLESGLLGQVLPR